MNLAVSSALLPECDEALVQFLSRLGLGCCLGGLLKADVVEASDLINAPAEELLAAGLNMIQVRRLLRHASSLGLNCLGGEAFGAFLSGVKVDREADLLLKGMWEVADLNEAKDDELLAAGLSPMQLRRVRRGLAQGGGGSGGAAHGGDLGEGSGGSGGGAAQYSGPGGDLAHGGVGTGGAGTSMAASQAATAAVLSVEHGRERNPYFGEQSILEAFT
jgi:hypothetical protein